MDIVRLTPTIGAEIRGIDVTDLSEARFKAIEQAFFDHSVVFFRDQPRLTPEQQIAFAKRFGPIHVHPAAPKDVEHTGLLTIHTHEHTRVAAGNRWHSDVSCDEAPPSATILQLHDLPPSGGDTLFASMYAAFDALSEPMKRLLEGMTAHHSGEWSYKKLFKFKVEDPTTAYPQADHPVVRKHPGSGKPALYVNREFTMQLNDLPHREGKAILEFLFEHVERADFQCRFQWTPNAIAMWDNRCVQHFAMWDYWPHERKGHRITVRGERPVAWSAG